MILVDTSVWVEHLRSGDARLKQLLLDNEVLCHDFVIGELACGNLKDRQNFLAYMATLPRAEHATHLEAMTLVETKRLRGKGIGWVDAHLAAATLLTNAKLWTIDTPLRKVAVQLGISA